MGFRMNSEAVINLALERVDGQVFVTCEEFPYLNLLIERSGDEEIVAKVFPVLKQMVEHQIGGPVSLRLVPTYSSSVSTAQMVAPHVIASRVPEHLG